MIYLPLLGIVYSPNLARGNSFEIAQIANCNNAQTNYEMRVCADRSYKAADKRLN